MRVQALKGWNNVMSLFQGKENAPRIGRSEPHPTPVVPDPMRLFTNILKRRLCLRQSINANAAIRLYL